MLSLLTLFVSTLISVSSYSLRLDKSLSLKWEIINPQSLDHQKTVKFTLILKNYKKGWAGIGWRLDPDNYPFPMANADYVICYFNEPRIDNKEMGCFDGYLFTNNQLGADGQTNWEAVMPIPVPDSNPLVGGRNNIEFLSNESYRKVKDKDVITKWVFFRKVNTGDPKDAILTNKNIQGIWAYHDSDANWETQNKKWNDNTRPSYHSNKNRGRFVFNLIPGEEDL